MPKGLREEEKMWKFTPGPWEFRKARCHFHIFGADKSEVVRVHCASPADNPTQAEMDAHLIASAPELLKALNTIVSKCAPFSSEKPFLDYVEISKIAKAAIAKAESSPVPGGRG